MSSLHSKNYHNAAVLVFFSRKCEKTLFEAFIPFLGTRWWILSVNENLTETLKIYELLSWILDKFTWMQFFYFVISNCLPNVFSFVVWIFFYVTQIFIGNFRRTNKTMRDNSRNNINKKKSWEVWFIG